MITNLINETTQEIINPNIVGDNIPTGAVDASKIATGAVTSEKIASRAVTSDKLATRAVTSDKLDLDSVDAQSIQANAIQSFHISAKAVTLAKMNFVSATLTRSLGSSDLQALYSLFVEIVTNPGYMKIYFEDSGEYSPLQIVNLEPSRLIFNLKGSTMTIGSDADASQFISDYGDYVFITRLA